MQYVRSCRDCQRRATGECYELGNTPCARFQLPPSREDKEARRNAKEAADERRYPKDRDFD